MNMNFHSLPNIEVSGAKDCGQNYIKVRPPLVAIFSVMKSSIVPYIHIYRTLRISSVYKNVSVK